MKSLKIIGSIFLAACCGTGFAQEERQGNIVEYFGKEKVEEIHEGDVLHVFKEGLILKDRDFPSPASSVTSDRILAKFVNQDEIEISEGETAYTNEDGEPVKWEEIEVTENNQFDERGLGDGYLYLEYDADSEKTVLFEASGHTNVLINGLPHEGDHYDFGWNLIPVRLQEGKNTFLLAGGRFSHMRARLLEPHQAVQFTPRDVTVPDLLREENKPLLGAIRVMNTTDQWFEGGSIVAHVGGAEQKTEISSISPMNIRKLAFTIPVPEELPEAESTRAILHLKDNRGRTLSTDTLELAIKSKYKHHKRTFLSDIDGSVQYYAVAPSLTKDKENQAMFLSVHGASVEAVNQANAYDQKDWGHLVAPTNRRPFGFAWEDWGRLDALEVLNHAEELYQTDPQHTYLTGHSMGGHGTWYLGATYPDRFAAIAPAAGYPDLIGYRESFTERAKDQPEEFFERFGTTKEEFLRKLNDDGLSSESQRSMDQLIRRAGNPSRTLKLKENYLHHGVYILHGEADSVVPTFIARDMRETLGTFHNDFVYYEYPDGTHWYGDHSVDWEPIFYFFKNREIKAPEDVKEIVFKTASPGVSSGSHFVTVVQQEKPFEISSFEFERENEEKQVSLKTENIATLALDLKAMAPADSIQHIVLDKQRLDMPEEHKTVYFEKDEDGWETSEKPSLEEKGPHRDGGFKNAFTNNVVFVYATKGSKEEDNWYYNRARFDAEKFWYRANGNIELVKDTDFEAEDYPDRNVIIYGNEDNNAAWDELLEESPVQVSDNKIEVGDKVLKGDQWGAYFIYPRDDSDTASVGVVTATGEKGMRGAYANDYLVNATFFPDLLIFDDSMMSEGISGVKASGFFSNEWEVEDGDIIWREE